MRRLVSDPVVARFAPKPEPYPNGGAAREISRAIADREAGTAYCFAIIVEGAFAGVWKPKEVSATQAALG